VLKDRLGYLVHQALVAPLDSLVYLETLETQANKGHQVQLVLQAVKGPQVLQVSKVQLEYLDRLDLVVMLDRMD
jgi:hypothetical protein